jgi:hypothetical protein
MHRIERAIRLWVGPLAPGDEGLAAFAQVYTDPVTVNGTPTPLPVLVERARMLQGAFEHVRHELLAQVDEPDRCSFAFRLGGRHVGPLETPLGVVPPSGRELEALAMDILVFDGDGKVAEVWAVADYLGFLQGAAAVALTT